MPHRRIVLALALALLLAPSAARAAGTPVRVIVPDADNLQYMAFWVARGAGYFEDEGITLDLSIPPKPVLAQSYFERGDAQVAILSPPMYLRLVAEGFPFVLVANILQNDPINLIVRRTVAEERGLRADQPLKERLAKLKGLRIGVAPGPPTRLRILFSTQGLDVDKEMDVLIVHGPDQNDAFASGKVDALYAHTPYLETALVEQGAMMLVNQSGGELSELAARQIHALVVTRAFAQKSAPLVAGMTRALYRAERLVHADHRATADAIQNALPALERRRVEKIVELYDAAVPLTPRVSAEGFAQALALYPAGMTAPDFSKIDRAAFVDPHFAEEAIGRSAPANGRTARLRLLWALVLSGLVFALLIALREARESAKNAP